ncbi:hypothetical protein [Novosphingobium sp.]|uniref:hypothetical protein n=1 Tax=Novosphingobium sp. TaxID=1874826 RepID=UPI002735A314|nr:hypothetical protein [Novosphingobium sp.]MDP3905892.1 hypothetical protein [Novosphingobium sp.]
MSLPRTLTLLSLIALAAPAQAQPGGWGDRGWGDRGWTSAPSGYARNARAVSVNREGKVQVARFVAEDPAAVAALGKGTVSVIEAPATSLVDAREMATYQAAVIDALAGAGYQTATPDGAHVAEVRVAHAVAEPQEAPKKPVSGEMMMGVSNRGTMMGMGINIDLTKPKGALVSTRLEARIRDRVSGAVLWEGRADILTRQGDARWTDQKIAQRLADALFEGFPAAGA